MHGPPVVGWLLVAVCGGTGVVCLARARCLATAPGRREAWLEAAMGWSMALMALPAAVPGAVSAALFGGTGLAALALSPVRTDRPGTPSRRCYDAACHLLHHVAGSGAMAAAALTASAGATEGHAGHAAGGTALPAALLACWFLAEALRRAAALAGAPAPLAPASSVPTAPSAPPQLAALPETGSACRVAHSLAMALMLVL